MKKQRVTTVHTLEAWRCRKCGYLYEEDAYLLPIRQCPQCSASDHFDRVTEAYEYHPCSNLMLLP